ncbi:SseB family protein [Flavobacterium nackdongense]|uniref:SseB family protein n=1 Tax=Flavobacterium nackdongense TaxID=2547394 RepID=A0A4P6YBR2_9FLAO|nr:SseB family protein [Flavobacterium nackdongense]QBN18214.1 SseB family protein [Flavobacterium nackdongense]
MSSDIESNTLENYRLLSLIDNWLETGNSGNSYENVVLELLNGNSHLFIEAVKSVGIEEGNSIGGKDSKLTFGIYEIENKKYLGAFTDLKLLEDWLKKTSRYVKLESKTLFKMADEIDVDGIVINTSYRNMFVVLRNKK